MGVFGYVEGGVGMDMGEISESNPFSHIPNPFLKAKKYIRSLAVNAGRRSVPARSQGTINNHKLSQHSNGTNTIAPFRPQSARFFNPRVTSRMVQRDSIKETLSRPSARKAHDALEIGWLPQIPFVYLRIEKHINI